MDKDTADTSAKPIELPVALGGELLIEILNLKLRIKCALVGMEAGQYLIIKIPPKDLIGNFQSETVKTSKMIVRFLHRDMVYSFEGELLNIVPTPAKLFFMAYPKKLDEMSVKERSRHECILPAYAMFGNDIVDMVIKDISREGCQCVIKVTVPKDEGLYKLIQVNKKLELRVQFPGSENKFDVGGRIRNVSKDVDRILVGLQFEDTPPEAKARIENFISLVSSSGAS